MTKISFLSRLTDFIAPRACAICGCRLAIDEDSICTRCTMRLPRTGYATSPYDNEMARAFWAKINVERCAALFFYHPHSSVSNVIHNIKYHNQPEAARYMGRLAAEEFMMSGFFDDIDFILPVPLSKPKIRERGYNQSEEIARGVTEATGIDLRNDIISRIRDTESQTKKHHWQRNENMKEAFRLTNDNAAKGRHILIIDDIVTTGSTICECGKELMKAGDVKISVLSLGYTKP